MTKCKLYDMIIIITNIFDIDHSFLRLQNLYLVSVIFVLEWKDKK